ncbi:peroxiredoxin-like family protein [Ancylobacter amanitiformis]|uniref:thioredoxin-dependent peroxiredoxin n=1 Tax=Ancylobacter amanitiformis TaxID=217069 RepID=A0ABU0LX73_9HYPH|nr:peroxiredoxin-like family protein [Ancylobacter amanitiformis]MDQ0513319.1 peroxiredoxin [Ancylobacter amanitiformis]
MSLDHDLAALRAEFARTAPEGRPALYAAKIEALRASFAVDEAIGVGDEAPDFTLPSAAGGGVTLGELLRSGPAVVTFYRGGWCPYCNLQLRAYQAIQPQIAALGARLVAVSPQLPDGSLDVAASNALTFDVLSDVGNQVARRYGLVFALPGELRDALRSNGKLLPEINGDDSWELPVPATYVVGQNRRVAAVGLDIDYRNRMSPEMLVASLRALSRG